MTAETKGTSQEMNELASAGQTKEQRNDVNDVNNDVQGDTAGNEPTNDYDGDQDYGGDYIRIHAELKCVHEEIDEELKRLNPELKLMQEEIQKKDKELKRLNSELKQKQEETGRKDEEVKRLNAELKWLKENTEEERKRLNSKLKQKQEETDKKEEELKRYADLRNKMTEDLSNCNGHITRLEEQLVRRKCDIDDLLHQLTHLSAEKMEVDENNKKYQETIGENKSDIEQLKISLEQQSKTFAAEKKIIVDANKKCHKIIGAQKSEIEKLKISLSEEKKAKSEKTEIIKTLEVNLKRQRDQLDNEMKREKNKMQEEVRNWYGSYKSVSNQHRAMQNDYANLKAELDRCNRHMKEQVAMNNELKSERDGYILRLTEVVSTRLTANNPNIADLSDENRPTKLAEIYSEIYDNDWTDAFTQFGEIDDKRGILLLRDFLKRTFEICQEIRDNQVSWIDSVTFTSVCTKDLVTSDEAEDNNTDLCEDQVGGRKPQEVSQQTDTTDPPARGPCKRTRTKDLVTSDEAEDNNTDLCDDQVGGRKPQEVSQQTDTTDPPASGPCKQTRKTIDVPLPESLKQEAIRIRKDLAPYRMKTLCKELPAILASEVGIELTEDKCALRWYLSSCVKLCWLMGLQRPPCYLQFDEDGSKFDRKIYKEYLKRGGVIDYVVWPPMLIHEGGALLAKGVAQGKD